MREFFDDLPKNGPVQLSKAFLNRMGRAVERADRFPTGFNFPGEAGNGRSGPWLYVDTSVYVFAEITAEHSDAYPGYSWQQRRPNSRTTDSGAAPEWKITEPMLSGDNGSEATGPSSVTITNVESLNGVATLTTSTFHEFVVGDLVTVSGLSNAQFNGTFRITGVGASSITYNFSGGTTSFTGDSGTADGESKPRRDVAYDFSGDTFIGVGTKVILVRGYLHTSTTNAADIPLSDPDNPDGGSSVDTEAAKGLEWIIIAKSSAGTGNTIRARITGKPTKVTDPSDSTKKVRHYPGVVRAKLGSPGSTLKDVDPPEAVWVVNDPGAFLGTTGDFIVEANKDGVVTVGEDTRPRYWTTDRIVMADFDCKTQQATYTGLFEGDLVGPEVYPKQAYPDQVFPPLVHP